MGQEEEGILLIVGLGNPGERYALTRHNIGFMVVEALAKQLAGSFVREKKVKGQLARLRLDGKGIVLLKPSTYMNESGQSVRRCLNYYKLKASQVLVICDDVDLPFGHLRLREKGGAGGHNGLKSIQQHLGTQDYPRLKMGVGDRKHGSLESHVLGRFNSEEMEQLDSFVDQALVAIKEVLSDDILEVMTRVNQKMKKENRASKTSRRLESGAGE